MNTAQNKNDEMKHDEDSDNSSGVAVLSENSPIRLGLIIALFSVAVATIGAAWYLASSLTKIETKLDSISTQMATTSSTTQATERRVADHERTDADVWRQHETRLSIIENIGSPKLVELQKRISDLENEFKVYQAINGKKP